MMDGTAQGKGQGVVQLKVFRSNHFKPPPHLQVSRQQWRCKTLFTPIQLPNGKLCSPIPHPHTCGARDFRGQMLQPASLAASMTSPAQALLTWRIRCHAVKESFSPLQHALRQAPVVGHIFPELLGMKGEEECCLEGFLAGHPASSFPRAGSQYSD